MMEEFHCKKCKFLLYKAEGELDVELICPKCRSINYPARKEYSTGLRGVDFQGKAIDHNCTRCHRLLLRSIGYGILSTCCRSCTKETTYPYLIEYNTLEMRNGNVPMTDEQISKKIRESIAK